MKRMVSFDDSAGLALPAEPEEDELDLDRRRAEERLIEMARKYREIAPTVSPELRAILMKT